MSELMPLEMAVLCKLHRAARMQALVLGWTEMVDGHTMTVELLVRPERHARAAIDVAAERRVGAGMRQRMVRQRPLRLKHLAALGALKLLRVAAIRLCRGRRDRRSPTRNAAWLRACRVGRHLHRFWRIVVRRRVPLVRVRLHHAQELELFGADMARPPLLLAAALPLMCLQLAALKQHAALLAQPAPAQPRVMRTPVLLQQVGAIAAELAVGAEENAVHRQMLTNLAFLAGRIRTVRTAKRLQLFVTSFRQRLRPSAQRTISITHRTSRQF